MKGEIHVYFDNSDAGPRLWWANVYLERAAFTPRWINSTSTYTTSEEAWREAKRILRAEVAFKELEQVVDQV